MAINSSDLPPVRGRITENAPLSQLTWFRVGGPADILFKPADKDDLVSFLKNCPRDIPLTVMGVASNLLIRDGGIKGIVIRLGREFAGINISDSGDTPSPSSRDAFLDPSRNGRGVLIGCGAAALDLNVAMVARDHGIEGLEFLSGIPGVIGGALRMNAGAYGSEIKDVLIEAEALDREGSLHRLSLEDMKLSYRHCGVPKDWIFTGCTLKGAPGDPAAIQQKMTQIQEARQGSQPIRARTGGSTFANPPGHKAWELIDQAGCRGLMIGGAQVSEQHCNFLINTGNASAADLENLGEEVRSRVLSKTGITLEWEIKRIGIP